MQNISKKMEKYAATATAMALRNANKLYSLFSSSKPYEISCFNCGKKVEREKAYFGIYCSKECRKEKLKKIDKKEDK